MTGALAPFNYLVYINLDIESRTYKIAPSITSVKVTAVIVAVS
jgi:hypothetical protein